LKETTWSKGKLILPVTCFSVNVSMTNFDDMMVDYPYAKDYAFDLFEKLHALQLLDEMQLNNYKKHVNNLANFE
jgi:hypothetical protein